MIEHVLRLKPGEDLLLSIDKYVKKHQIEAGYIATGVGSLSKVAFRKGYERTSLIIEGGLEMISLSGTISIGGMHIHMAVSDQEFNLKGGHVKLGTIIRTTAEIVLIQLDHHELRRDKDNIHGHKELSIRKVPNICTER